jgi:AbrB family looped-hinge helix DNA binding protein
MISVLRKKSQVTIPKDIVKNLGLSEGDQLEISEEDGVIRIMPVAVYPKKYIEELREEIEVAKEKIASGGQPVFKTVDELMDKLEEK